MSSKDTDFLKQRVTAAAQPKEATTTSTNVSTIDSANTFLEDVTADEPDTLTPRQRRLKRLAEQSNANNPDKVVQEETPPVPEDDEQSTIDISDRASKVVTSMSENVNPLIDKVGSLPTVGGIGLLVLILVILLFTVVQVNAQGDTRMKQLWYMLNGRATIKGRQQVTAAVPIPGTGNSILDLGPGAKGVGGTFGTGGTPPSDNTAVTHNSGSDLGF